MHTSNIVALQKVVRSSHVQLHEQVDRVFLPCGHTSEGWQKVEDCLRSTKSSAQVQAGRNAITGSMQLDQRKGKLDRAYAERHS